MGLLESILILVAGFVQLIIALGLAVFAIYVGINLLDKLTKGIEEIEELKKGNIAVGIMIAAVVISISIVIQSGIKGMTAGLGATADVMAILTAIGTGFLAVIIGMVFAVIGIFMAIWLMQKILEGMNPIEMVAEKVTGQDLVKNVNLQEELAKGNIAIGIMLAGILIAVSVVIQSGVDGIVTALSNFKI